MGKTKPTRKCFLPYSENFFVYFKIPFHELQKRTILMR